MASHKHINHRKLILLLLLIISFGIYFYISLHLPMEQAPDEYMRYDVPLYIFHHGNLPSGFEESIRNSVWGFSYAFTPYGSSLIAVLFMKVVGLFTGNAFTLLVAARLVSVLSGVGTLYFLVKIGRKVFPHSALQYLPAVLCGFLPQFAFLSAYFNSDVFGIFTTAMIAYGWLYCLEHRWDLRSCLFLGVSIGLCAMSYYNVYAFILGSIFLFLGDRLLNQPGLTWKNRLISLLRPGICIAVVALVLAGWFFIRNFIMYNGDFLGMDTMYACGEKYAPDFYKPSNRPTPANSGVSVIDMLTKPYMGLMWVSTSIKSFIGVFGYMTAYAPRSIYFIYTLFFAISIFLGLFYIISHSNSVQKRLLAFNGFLCVIVPVILSVKYSYSIDYQPQGRYCIPALLPLVLWISCGFAWTIEKVKLKKKHLPAHVLSRPQASTLEDRLVVFSASVVYIALFFYVMISTLLPLCTV